MKRNPEKDEEIFLSFFFNQYFEALVAYATRYCFLHGLPISLAEAYVKQVFVEIDEEEQHAINQLLHQHTKITRRIYNLMCKHLKEKIKSDKQGKC